MTKPKPAGQPADEEVVYLTAPDPVLPIYWVDGAPYAYDGATLAYAPYIYAQRRPRSEQDARPETDS